MSTPFVYRTDTLSRLARPVVRAPTMQQASAVDGVGAGANDEQQRVDANTMTWPRRDTYAHEQEKQFADNALTLTKRIKAQKRHGDSKKFTIAELASNAIDEPDAPKAHAVEATSGDAIGSQATLSVAVTSAASTASVLASAIAAANAQPNASSASLWAVSSSKSTTIATTTTGTSTVATTPDAKTDVVTPPDYKIKVSDAGTAGAAVTGVAVEDNPEWHTEPRTGLTTAEAKIRLLKYGNNEIVEHKIPAWKKFGSYFTGSISYLIEIAIILSAALQDWTDFGIITALLFINALIGFLEESRAESAVEALRSTLAQHSKVIRDSTIADIPSKELVPGDIIALRLGDVVPADCRLLGLTTNMEETKNELSVDTSALTGESLPQSKRKGDELWSSSIVKQGQMLAVVVKTGERTFVGRAAHLMNMTQESGHFQAVVHQIGQFLIYITLILVAIIIIIPLAQRRYSEMLQQVQYALVLTIASIPVGLPTVLSVTMAVGAKQLASKNVIVKRLTAVEEMAGLDVLCSDKTGTLTKNELTLDKPYLHNGNTNEDLLLAAYLASEAGANDAIELCVRHTAVLDVAELKGVDCKSSATPGYRVLQFQPFDPVTKLTRATVHKLLPGEDIAHLDEHHVEVYSVAKGAPQVILRMCKLDHDEGVQQAIAKMASEGLRALGVARSRPMMGVDDEKIDWELVGLISLLDPPREDSERTIAECGHHGLQVKMVTGDAVLIAKEVAKRLKIHRNILTPPHLNSDRAIVDKYVKCGEYKTDAEYEKAVSQLKANSVEYQDKLESIAHCIGRCDGFAQVVPEDKYRVVELLQLDGHMVGMTGDGVNDAPALKKANVGIAVHGATDAARSAASIVLLEPGLHAIVDGIMVSRQIFQRMRSYAVYRITSTIHFLLFLFLTITIWNFFIPAVLIVLIAILNDAAVLVISVDNALISDKPDKWRMGQMLTLSTILGVLLVGASFAHFLIGIYVIGEDLEVMKTVMYLQISSCPHFLIFSTRLSQPWYKQPPSLIFFLAVFLTQVFAMFISVYGVLSAPCGWGWGASVMGISLVYFMVLDLFKCWLYRKWSFEMTAKVCFCDKERQAKLEKKQARHSKQERVAAVVKKIRRVVNAVRFAKKMRHYRELPEAKFQMPVAAHH